jgi:hypothetical protein
MSTTCCEKCLVLENEDMHHAIQMCENAACKCHTSTSQEKQEWCEHGDTKGACDYINCPFTMFPPEEEKAV